MNLNDSWSKLTSMVPTGFWVVLGIIGVAFIVFQCASWFLKSRGGGMNAKSFPWLPVFGALILCLPTIVVPLLLGIFQGLLNIVIAIVEFFVGQLG